MGKPWTGRAAASNLLATITIPAGRAIMDDEKLGKAQRLDLLRDLLEELATGIRCSQMALVETPDPTDIACLVAFSLGRLGWMADRGLAVAGDDGPGVVGGAGNWLLCPVGRRSHKARGGR